MAKSLSDRKVNRAVKKLNKSIREDVFGNRFWIRQARKTRGNDGVMYYLYELIDRECPERNTLCKGWKSEFSILWFSELWIEMNDFIVNSDFWEKHRANNL